MTADRVRDTTGKSTLTADRIPYAAGWNTMTADKVHYTTAETLRRPTEYFRILRKHRGGRQNIQSDYYRLLVQLENLFFFFVFSFLFVKTYPQNLTCWPISWEFEFHAHLPLIHL